jgi:hypothetical protein
MQYIELAKGRFNGVAEGRTAFILWLAPQRAASRYTYQLWPLRGRIVDDREYVLAEYADSRKWLVLARGLLREYGFIRFRSETPAEILVRTRLSLRLVARTPELDQRLPYSELE